MTSTTKKSLESKFSGMSLGLLFTFICHVFMFHYFAFYMGRKSATCILVFFIIITVSLMDVAVVWDYWDVSQGICY